MTGDIVRVILSASKIKIQVHVHVQLVVFCTMSTDSGVEELRHRGSSVESSGVTGKSWSGCVCVCVCELRIFYHFTASPKNHFEHKIR